MPGEKVVILGSGDIGLIMARRMTFEGAKVQVVAELMPYSGGLKRNIVQCLDDYDIPLKLSHTVVDIKGKDRVEAVTIAQVDEKLKPIPGTEETYECDTLLLSCGLIPENELSGKLGVELSTVTSGPIKISHDCLQIRLYSAMGRPVKQRNLFLLNGCNFPGKPAKMNSALIFQI